MAGNFGLVKFKKEKEFKKEKKKGGERHYFLNSQQFLFQPEILVQSPCDFLFSFHVSLLSSF